MVEFNVPKQYQSLEIVRGKPADLFPLVIAILGDEAARLAGMDLEQSVESPRLLPDDPATLRFAATFLHTYVQSRQEEFIVAELLLLSAGAYYLSDLAGSASVVTREATALGTEEDKWIATFRWVLEANWDSELHLPNDPFAGYHRLLVSALKGYFANGSQRSQILAMCDSLRKQAYDLGSARDLLIADILVGTIKKRLRNSARYVLPIYSALAEDRWRETLVKPGFMKELWPSQHVFGEKGLFQGRSAVIQMPTSAGKTRAIELVIRSAFYSDRANLVVIVAPFRALCSEITTFLRNAFHDEEVSINELTDAMLPDYTGLFGGFFGYDYLSLAIDSEPSRRILVVTPEKLLYVLRHNPEVVGEMGVVVYDEGHQFDSGSRGVVYELLLTSIKSLISRETQTVLISAVIQNAQAIGNWLVGEEVTVVEGQDLSTTDRSVAFTSWTTPLGQLQFVDPNNHDHYDYFVPRIIDVRSLKTRGKEKPKNFPEKNPQAVALYLGLQVVANGSVAVFCPRKATASTMTKIIVDAYERGLTMPPPATFSDPSELQKLISLYRAHFGPDAGPTKAAILGIFSHHGSTPHGIRLAVEHAMKEGLARFVLCTSTLAQGVNLPIRYLIVSGTMQGAEQIKARDFHNLVGRAGRAGMHTEGTILFSDPTLYDNRTVFRDKWRWNAATSLLGQDGTEATASSLLGVLSHFQNDLKTQRLDVEMVPLLMDSLRNPGPVFEMLSMTATAHAKLRFTEAGLHGQLREKLRLMETLESYLMSHRGSEPFSEFLTSAENLAKETLAYHLADEVQRPLLLQLFREIALHIEKQEPDTKVQTLYGRTLLGLQTASRIMAWTLENRADLNFADSNEDELLEATWPLITEVLSERIFEKYSPATAVAELVRGWIANKPFSVLYDEFRAAGGAKRWGKTTTQAKVEDMVDICENAFGFESTLVLAAIAEVLSSLEDESLEGAIKGLGALQKRLKYGVADSESIALFELGFADRVIAGGLSEKLAPGSDEPMRQQIRDQEGTLRAALSLYPQYFTVCFNGLV
jgi:hypothetical protein